MGLSRRGFFRHTLAVGPVAMTLWLETGSSPGQGGAECTLPTPGTPTEFVPNEPKVVERVSAADLGGSGKTTQLQQFRDAIGLVRGLPADDVRGWTKQIAQHCIS